MSYPQQPPGPHPGEGGDPWQQPPPVPGAGPPPGSPPYGPPPGSPPPNYGQSPQPPYQQPPPGYQGGYPPPPPPPPPPGYGGQFPPPGPPPKKSPAVPIAIVVVVVLLLGGGAFGAWWYFGNDDDSNNSSSDSNTTDEVNEPEPERIEDTEAGLSYIEMDGWEFTESGELIDEFSSAYMAGGEETNVDVGAIYGAWGERQGEDLASVTDDMVYNNAYFFFPEIEEVEDVASDEATAGDVPAHDSRIIIHSADEPPMYIRAFAVDIDGRIAGLIGLADNDNQERVDELNEIIDSMEIIDHE